MTTLLGRNAFPCKLRMKRETQVRGEVKRKEYNLGKLRYTFQKKIRFVYYKLTTLIEQMLWFLFLM